MHVPDQTTNKSANGAFAGSGQAPASESVATGTLSLYPGNPRRGDLDAIKESLAAHGQFRPLVVNRPTMQVLAGNHTLMAARELGWPEVAVVFVDVDDERARRIVLVDNRTADLAGYDSESLAQLLADLDGDFHGTAYEQVDLDALLDELSEPLALDDEVPPLPAEPQLRRGDLVALGEHRLICADARDPAALARLMDGEHVGLLWTDPPYGIDYQGRTADRMRIAGDSPEGLGALLRDAFAGVDPWLAAGAPLYVCHPSGALAMTFMSAFVSQGWSLRQGLVWLKDAIVVGHADYQYRHEPILYGFKPGPGRLGRGGSRWHGGNRQASVIEVARPRAAREHPTMKPPELIEICLRNSCRRRDLVLDPFAGSGSTLAACERLGRRARLVELDPRYADVIVARYEALTGKQAMVL